MNHRFRAAFAVSAVLGAGLFLSACQDDSGATGDDSAKSTASSTATSSSSSQSSPGATGTGGAGSGQASPSAADTAGTARSGGGGGGKSTGTDAAQTPDDGAADKTGYGQSCGSNDLRWAAKSMTQAGGYLQISVSAKPGITCVLPGGLPVVAFGSGGTEAHPAEQSAGGEITLSGGTTLYAGVNPKTTNSDGGTEYSTVIVSVSDGDPHPVSLSVGNIVVDQPIVTNWHTNPADAVPAG
ncbi:DUF4232 domain-containing protein [Streptomyces sp. NPDC051132]|uniref:DUF4232 domain-containing protein n=1 Tax=unclassified Streptomyces TaxID=2593676 RepID=UPI00344476B9